MATETKKLPGADHRAAKRLVTERLEVFLSSGNGASLIHDVLAVFGLDDYEQEAAIANLNLTAMIDDVSSEMLHKVTTAGRAAAMHKFY